MYNLCTDLSKNTTCDVMQQFLSISAGDNLVALQLYGHHLSVNLHYKGQNTLEKVIKHRFGVKQIAAIRTPL